MITALNQLGGSTSSVKPQVKEVQVDEIELNKEYRNVLNFLKAKGIVVSLDIAKSIKNDLIRNQQIERL